MVQVTEDSIQQEEIHEEDDKFYNCFDIQLDNDNSIENYNYRKNLKEENEQKERDQRIFFSEEEGRTVHHLNEG